MGRTSNSKEKLMKAVTELIWIGSYGSTTIDQICEKAGVKKGSFYYFFESKAALAEEAIQAAWEEYRARLDQVFSPSMPALERIRKYCDFEYHEQLNLKQQYGFALGCPLCTLGTEISTLDPGLRKTVNDIMDQGGRYFESAIRDGLAEGAIENVDVDGKAKAVHAYVEGLMIQVRIKDDVELLKAMRQGIFDVLGVSDRAISA